MSTRVNLSLPEAPAGGRLVRLLWSTSRRVESLALPTNARGGEVIEVEMPDGVMAGKGRPEEFLAVFEVGGVEVTRGVRSVITNVDSNTSSILKQPSNNGNNAASRSPELFQGIRRSTTPPATRISQNKRVLIVGSKEDLLNVAPYAGMQVVQKHKFRKLDAA